MPKVNQTVLPGTAYEIMVRGSLDESWSDWFCGMTILTGAPHGTEQISILKGPVVDQSALRGLLCKLWDMNLTLISVRRLESYEAQEK